jgi:hypothetical protein
MSRVITSLEHVLAELERLDLLLRVQLWRSRQRPGDRGDTAAFYVPDGEPEALLDQALAAPAWSAVPLPAQLQERVQARLDELAANVALDAAASISEGGGLRLVTLSWMFGLDVFDIDVVLACLAPELDRRYERIYAYLHDDVTRSRPTIGLLLDLFCPDLQAKVAARTRFGATAPLMRHQLLRLGDEAGRWPSWQPAEPSLGSGLRLDPRVTAFLLGDDEPDQRLASCAMVVDPAAPPAPLILPDSAQRQVQQLADHGSDDGDDLVVYLQGPYGAGKQSMARACCERLGARLLIVRHELAAPGLAPAELAVLAWLIDREARLQGALLYWEGFDALLHEECAAHLAAVAPVLAQRPGPTFLAGETSWEPADALRGSAFVRLEVPLPGAARRQRQWQAALAEPGETDGLDLAGLDVAALAGTFRLSGGQIRDAVATARSLARRRDLAAPQVSQADLYAACRLQSNRKLAELAQQIAPHYSWDDIVLPPDRMQQLRELHDQIRYRELVYDRWGFDRKLAMGKGVDVLFAGPPGTGKTMAADVLASALGLDLYKIDLSTVVSKYIGETEKNLARIFAEARTSDAILFFDEADALFGKRTQVSDAHDRYANIEVSYLLQRIEEHQGIVVLASNLRGNIDEAFVRRLHAVVEFPLPDVADRRRIWERIWPQATPLSPDLDLDVLASQVQVAGGSIRNIALAGAFLAAADGGVVTMAHLLRATQREYQKIGKVLGGADAAAWGQARHDPS